GAAGRGAATGEECGRQERRERTQPPRGPGAEHPDTRSARRLDDKRRWLDGDFFGRDEAQLAPDLLLDRLARRRILFQELLDVFAPLAQALPAEGEPRPALFDDLAVDRQVEQIALLRDALAIHHVELRFAEGRRHFVLDDLHAGAAADDDVAVLDGADAANVDAHRRVELQRTATGRRFGIPEHDAD